MTTEQKTLYTQKEAADVLGVSPHIVRNLVNAGTLTPVEGTKRLPASQIDHLKRKWIGEAQ